jgi:hypothetical protein
MPGFAAESSLGRAPAFDFRAHFCHSAPMETHGFGFRPRANTPEGQKQFPMSDTTPQMGNFLEASDKRCYDR